MGEPFTLKDMEATGDVARSLEQYVEKYVTIVEGNVLAALAGEKQLKYTSQEWKRFIMFMFDEDVIDDFNRLVILAKRKEIDLNTNEFFLTKFLENFRPQYKKLIRGMAQIIQLSSMANLERPKKKAEDFIQEIHMKKIRGLIP